MCEFCSLVSFDDIILYQVSASFLFLLKRKILGRVFLCRSVTLSRCLSVPVSLCLLVTLSLCLSLAVAVSRSLGLTGSYRSASVSGLPNVYANKERERTHTASLGRLASISREEQRAAHAQAEA